MQTTNLNATLDCIKETTTITTRIITNVCTGDVTSIPIGFWNFVGITLGITLTIGFITLFYAIFKDIRNY